MKRWQAYEAPDKLKPPAVEAESTAGGDSVLRSVQHVWPAHEATQLHSTRVDTMFTSDHYPLIADFPFLGVREAPVNGKHNGVGDDGVASIRS